MKGDERLEAKATRSTRRTGAKLVGTRRVTDAGHQLAHASNQPIARANGETETATPEQTRHRRICERAFQLAERRGFAPGKDVDDWLQAEREVDSEALDGPGA
jgi:hypothetical protein